MLTGEIKMTTALYAAMLQDLSRPHPHAWERVGFAYGKLSMTPGLVPIIYLYRYSGVEDERYLESDEYGALIDRYAILQVRQELRKRRGMHECAFHVHVHEHHGQPGLSKPDRQSLPSLIPSFQLMDPTGAHGLLVLSSDHGIAWVWLPGESQPCPARAITIVGAPMRVFQMEVEYEH